MRVVPKSLSGKIRFYTSHLEKWAEDPAAIGSTPEEIADLAEKLDAARAAFERQGETRNAARSATLGLRIAVDALANAGGSVILRVRAKARTDGGAVYSGASIRRPKNPAPIAAPGQPTSFAVQLQQTGLLKLTWKCRNPAGSQGTMYEVQRSLGPDMFASAAGPFEFVGQVGVKKFIDTKIPAGTGCVTYRVTAIRTTRRGASADYFVNFGVNASRARVAVMQRAA